MSKGPSSQGYGFSSSHVWMWDWTIMKAEHQRIDAFELWCLLEKTLESPLDCKAIQPVHPKGNWSWIFIGRTDVEAETLILWPPDVMNWLIWEDLDARKERRQEEKGTKEDEVVGWHHQLTWHEFEWTPGVGDGQGGLACCSPWDCKSQTWLSNWIELNVYSKHQIYPIIIVIKSN